MPKLQPHELGDDATIDCQSDRCTARAKVSGSGFTLPFCRDHLERLPEGKYELLLDLASASVFDVEAIWLATRHLNDCLDWLRRK